VGALWLAVRPAGDGNAAGAEPVTYLALGDSVASGHGLGTKAQPGSGEQTYLPGVGCQRSTGQTAETSSYTDVVAEALEGRFARVMYEKLACSGHDTTQLLELQLPRADQVLAGRGQAVVTITIGANNYSFWDPRSYLHVFDLSQGGFDQWRQAIEGGVRRDVAAALEHLGRDHGDRRLLVTEYFNPFNSGATVFDVTAACREGLSCGSRMVATIDGLNAALRGAVADYAGRRQPGWGGAGLAGGVAAAFRDHAAPRPACGSATPDLAGSWIQSPRVPALLTSLIGQQRVGAGNDCFHPNATGHRELARLVMAALDGVR
jgi:lysophospholipase L1-like esterase